MSQSIKNQLKKHPHWSEIKQIVLKLSQHGFEVFIVGGAVRNALLNKTVKDVDLATSAKPEHISKLFPKSNSSFAKYGVIFIPLKNNHKIEITTFRKDSSYKDGRRPQSVQYSSIEEDAKRRDFTINALFYDLKTDQIIDLVSGIKDLKNKKIKAVGKAEKRLEEDHLRMLRALRQAHQLSFKLDKSLQKAILKLSQNISSISKERVLDELMKMFSIGKIDQALKSLNNCGLLQPVLPQLAESLSDLSFKNPRFQKQNSHTKKTNKIIIKKNPFNFWKQKFSFYQEPAFCWAVIGLPFFYSDIKKFSAFVKNYPIKNTIIKKSLSYLKSVQTLIDSKSAFAEQLIAFNGQKSQVYELTYNFLESGVLKNKNLPKLKQNLKFVFKEFHKREVKNKLPPALIKGADLLKLSPPVKKSHFSKILKQAFNYQMEKPKLKKKDILKKLGYK
ncbi:MAG: CCA tRNA nucleotidyltransferase [Oligoflexia bacterium]|nr:CCA tRNA nucleotidyltransferase [Oligoflexia bacterium]